MHKKPLFSVIFVINAISLLSFGIFAYILIAVPWFNLPFGDVQLALSASVLLPFIVSGIVAGLHFAQVKQAYFCVLFCCCTLIFAGTLISLIWINKAIACFTFIALLMPIGIVCYCGVLNGTHVFKHCPQQRVMALLFAVGSPVIYLLGSFLTYVVAYAILGTTPAQTTPCAVRAVPVWPATIVFYVFLIVPFLVGGIVSGKRVPDKHYGLKFDSFLYMNFFVLMIFVLYDHFIAYVNDTNYLHIFLSVAAAFVTFRVSYTLSRKEE